jgi:hypothetical protein
LGGKQLLTGEGYLPEADAARALVELPARLGSRVPVVLDQWQLVCHSHNYAAVL